MKNKSYKPYLILGAALICLFYVPKAVVDGIRASSTSIKKGSKAFSSKSNLETETLQAENLLLKNQNEKLRKFLFLEDRVSRHIKRTKELIELNEKKVDDFYLRRRKAQEERLEKELFFQVGEVICREPASWSSTLWINLGEGEIEANSPVLKGDNLIGLVEVVGKHKSRVRLLTDSMLVPSVRVAREGEHLAKGELHGSGSPLWRGRSEVLKGFGFNYDFDDEEGPARELRSGRPHQMLSRGENLSLIEVGDLLVTTGMDGVFPKDIPVATVTKVEMLKEGSVSVGIEAILCAGSLNDLSEVIVLPPTKKEIR